MGTCTSAANYESSDNGKPFRDTEGGPSKRECTNIEQWSANRVYQWLSTIENGDLQELAIKFRNERIKGKVLENVSDSQLKEMGVRMGDQLLFKQARKALFAKYNYHTTLIHSSHPISHPISHPMQHQLPQTLKASHSNGSNVSSHGNRSNANNSNEAINASPIYSNPGGYPLPPPQQQQQVLTSNGRYQQQQSPGQYMPIGIPTTKLIHGGFSGGSNDKSQEQLHTVTEYTNDPYDNYAAIDVKDLNLGEEGINNNNKMPIIHNNKSNSNSKSESKSKSLNKKDINNNDNGDHGKHPMNKGGVAKLKHSSNIIKKPPLPIRSLSVPVEDYKKQGQGAFHQQRPYGSNINLQQTHPHSLSNPVYGQKYNANIGHNKPIFEMAKVLKTSMTNQAKTATEIIEILQQSNNENIDKQSVERVYNELIKIKLLVKNKNPANDSNTNTDKYTFDHTMYDKLILQQQHNSIPHYPPSLRPAALPTSSKDDEIYPGGTPVTVFSPKSQQWREGLVLDFNRNTKVARVCCYNKFNMTKQSVKEISLPSDLVRPKLDYNNNGNGNGNSNVRTSQPIQYPNVPPVVNYTMVNDMTAEAWNSMHSNKNC
mmetsp:Transcript_71587/g.64266  ORF Transcript_71587/g.64266 Transcript_71587/m.64266 type:complete len:598 (-) Transcript_71587:243-2036(-)